jgi:hypothetical protein
MNTDNKNNLQQNWNNNRACKLLSTGGGVFNVQVGEYCSEGDITTSTITSSTSTSTSTRTTTSNSNVRSNSNGISACTSTTIGLRGIFREPFVSKNSVCFALYL